MKRMILVFAYLLFPLLSQAQTSIGLALSSLLYKELNIGAEHKVSEHWSILGSAGMNLKVHKRNISNEELEHSNSFYAGGLPTERPFTHREKFSVRYWSDKVYSGVMLSLGGEYRTDTKLDANFGIGYMFPIWKGLAGTVIYETGIIRSCKAQKLAIDDFKVELNWIF